MLIYVHIYDTYLIMSMQIIIIIIIIYLHGNIGLVYLKLLNRYRPYRHMAVHCNCSYDIKVCNIIYRAYPNYNV